QERLCGNTAGATVATAHDTQRRTAPEFSLWSTRRRAHPWKNLTDVPPTATGTPTGADLPAELRLGRGPGLQPDRRKEDRDQLRAEGAARHCLRRCRARCASRRQ